jgi:uncharacterized protein YbaP (TraB family)
MRRLVFCFLCFLALQSSACKSKDVAPSDTRVEPPRAEAPEAAKPAEPPKEPAAERYEPFMWQIQGPNGPVYLLGTIHIGVSIDEPGYALVRQRFDEATMFVMETNLNDVKDDMASGMAIPAGQPNLEEQLGPKAWAAFEERVGTSAAATVRSFQPWVIVSMLIGKMLEGLPPASPMDHTLAQRAAEANKELDYLEPPELQIELLKKHLNAEELKEMILDFDKQREDLMKMMIAYKTVDVEAITTLSFKDKDRKPEMYEDMFYKRNRAWIPHIKRYIERGNVFVAFGAGHMVGDDGVLDLLKKEGIEVKRSPLPSP